MYKIKQSSDVAADWWEDGMEPGDRLFASEEEAQEYMDEWFRGPGYREADSDPERELSIVLTPESE